MRLVSIEPTLLLFLLIQNFLGLDKKFQNSINCDKGSKLYNKYDCNYINKNIPSNNPIKQCINNNNSPEKMKTVVVAETLLNVKDEKSLCKNQNGNV